MTKDEALNFIRFLLAMRAAPKSSVSVLCELVVVR